MRPQRGRALASGTGRSLHFHYARGFGNNPKTRTPLALLGPCFQTGRMEPCVRQRPQRTSWSASLASAPSRRRSLLAVTRLAARSPASDPAPGRSLRSTVRTGSQSFLGHPRSLEPRAVSSPTQADANVEGTYPATLLDRKMTAVGGLQTGVRKPRRACSRGTQPGSLRAQRPNRDALNPKGAIMATFVSLPTVSRSL